MADSAAMIDEDAPEAPPERRDAGLKRYLPKTLFGRSLLILVTPLLIVQIVSAYVFYERHWDTMSKRLSHAVAAEIAVAVTLLDQAGEDDAARRNALNTVERPTMLQMSLEPNLDLPEDARSRGQGFLEYHLNRAMEEWVNRPFVMDTLSEEDRVIIYVDLAAGLLEVSVPQDRLFSSTTYVFVLWMVGSSIILLAIASIFMHNQVKPIRRLAAAAEAFGKGRDLGDFKIGGAREVRQAGSAFKLMRDRIRRQITQRTEMLAGVSHDLRTPLTRMKLELALLKDDEAAQSLQGDINEMERMLEGYLAFARGDVARPARLISMSEILTEVTEDARRAGLQVDLECPAELEAMLQADGFRRCMTNLISNGGRHGSHVWVAARKRDSMVEVTVDDDGPGVPLLLRHKVFRPFFRVEGSRNTRTGGTGLGLSIARDVVHAHGGEIFLEDAPQGGLRARIEIPD